MIKNENKDMATQTLDPDTRICVYCDFPTLAYFCPKCNEYKGLMTIAEWESYTEETWED